MISEFPLLQRLIDDLSLPLATTENLDELIDQHPCLVLFYPGSPTRFPESNDVAVILPEILQAFADDGLTAAIVPEEHESAVKARFPFDMWPALVFVKNGFALGSICKVQDWADYISQIKALLASRQYLEQTIPTQSLQGGL